jgi:VRR-NUC domain.
MARQPEGRLVGKILDFLRANYPGWWEKIHGSVFQSRGVPDIIGCYRGRFISIEAKMPGEQPTALQKDNGQMIKEAKGIWIVAYSVEDVRRTMERYFKR